MTQALICQALEGRRVCLPDRQKNKEIKFLKNYEVGLTFYQFQVKTNI